MSVPSLKLTEYELKAWHEEFNFTDGHARYYSNQQVYNVIQNLASSNDFSLLQDEVEYKFHKAFFGFTKQLSLDCSHILYNSSASLSIEIAANYLRVNKHRVALIEPTFDNISDILKRHNVQLVPIAESSLNDTLNINELYKSGGGFSALFLVLPNNPTGFVLDKSSFTRLIEFCVSKQILVVLDFSFRFYSIDMYLWDAYKILIESGVSYITIEDTGKTWPSLELKVSPLVVSASIFEEIKSIYADLFICISPFNLVLLNYLITNCSSIDSETGILSIASRNRTRLRAAIIEFPLYPITLGNMPVEWIRLGSNLVDTEVERFCRSYGIHFLPGHNFFWSRPSNVTDFIRFALMRDESMFTRGMEKLSYSLRHLFNLSSSTV